MKKLNNQNKPPLFLRSITILLITVLLCSFCVFPCFAASDTHCGITVNVMYGEEEENLPVADFELGLSQIAEVSGDDFVPTDAFADSGISLENLTDKDNSQHAEEIYQYIRKNEIPYMPAKSDSAGKAVFSDLNKGIYLVFSEEQQNYTFNPYIIFIPTIINGVELYRIDSAPKTGISGTNISVTKLWDDSDDYAGKRPDSITVVLKRNDLEYRTAELDSDCGWQYTFARLPYDGDYTVEEKEVPGDYKASYGGNAESGFTITNSYIYNSPIGKFLETGSGGYIILIAVLLLSSAVCAAIVVFSKRKKNSD